MNSKRARRRDIALLPEGVEWWFALPDREIRGTVTRLLMVRDEWGRDRHPVMVVRPDGADRELAIPDCVRSRAIAQVSPIGMRVLVRSAGWVRDAASRSHRDLRIHLARPTERG